MSIEVTYHNFRAGWNDELVRIVINVKALSLDSRNTALDSILLSPTRWKATNLDHSVAFTIKILALKLTFHRLLLLMLVQKLFVREDCHTCLLALTATVPIGIAVAISIALSASKYESCLLKNKCS
jgi:hypothetical protein